MRLWIRKMRLFPCFLAVKTLPNCHFFTTDSAISCYKHIANLSQRYKFTTTT